jgi:hypothetical protein
MQSVVDRNVVMWCIPVCQRDYIVTIILIYVYITLLMRVRKAFAGSNHYLYHVCLSVRPSVRPSA